MSAWVWGGAMVVASLAGIVAGMRSVSRKRDAFRLRWQEECRRYEAAARANDPSSDFINKHYED